MRKIYVVYKITCLKNNAVKYGITHYNAYFIFSKIYGSPIEQSLLKSINKKSTDSKLFKVEWLYQNIEEQECKRYLELAYNVKESEIGVVQGVTGIPEKKEK